MAGGAGQPLRSHWPETKQEMHERLKAEAVLPMPVLLNWGMNDPQATLERAMALYDNLAAHHAKVRLLWVNKAGHFHFREYPDEFNHNVMTFIDYWNCQTAGTSSGLD